MSSIGSTLNSINASLLSEINAYKSNSSASTASCTQTSAASSTDQIDFSQVAAANKLRAAVGHQTGSAAAFLKDLSDRFQKAADTGDLSELKPTSSSSAAPRPHHHHHGGGHVDATTNSPQDLISGILNSSSTNSATNSIESVLQFATRFNRQR